MSEQPWAPLVPCERRKSRNGSQRIYPRIHFSPRRRKEWKGGGSAFSGHEHFCLKDQHIIWLNPVFRAETSMQRPNTEKHKPILLSLSSVEDRRQTQSLEAPLHPLQSFFLQLFQMFSLAPEETMALSCKRNSRISTALRTGLRNSESWQLSPIIDGNTRAASPNRTPTPPFPTEISRDVKYNWDT